VPDFTDPLAPPAGYQHDEDDKPLDDRQCDVHEAPSVLLPVACRCSGQGALRIWFACPREHMGFADVCARHRYEILAGFPAACARCAQAREPSRSTIIRKDDHDA
jgi:hypothetical protein